jgi:hypothetical protein
MIVNEDHAQEGAFITEQKKEKRKLTDVEEIKMDDMEMKQKSSKIGKLPDEKKKKKKKKSVDVLEPKKKEKKTISNMSNIEAKEDNQTNEGVLTTLDPAIANGDQAQEGPSIVPKRLSAYEEYKLAMKEAGLQSNSDDDDDEDAAEGSSSEDEAADGSYLVDKQGSKSKQAKLSKPQDPPKKKGTSAKVKKYKRPKEEKRAPTEEKKRNEQRKKFKDCEEKYGAIVRRWEKAIDNEDKDQLRKIYNQILDVVHNFTAPFIEVYKLSALMKRSKRIMNDDKRKELFAKLKEQYEKKRAEVPSR